MTIEFRCPQCDKLLRTADDKAGVQANCPGCGELVTVPGPGATEYPTAAVETESAARQICPMCGAGNTASESRCRVCGEALAPAGSTQIHPTVLDLGMVLNVAWRLYQTNFGLCVGSSAIILGVGLFLLGWMMCFIGLLFALGLIRLMEAVAYQMAAGRPVTRVNA